MKIQISLSTPMSGMPRPTSTLSYHNEYRFNPAAIYDATFKGKLHFTRALVPSNIPKWRFINKELAAEILNGAATHIPKVGKELDIEKARDYARRVKKTGSVPPPVMMALDKENKSFLIDGSHRMLAAHLLGVHEVPAYVWRLADLLSTSYCDQPVAWKE